MNWFKSRWNNLPPSTRRATKQLAWALGLSTLATIASYYLAAIAFGVPWPQLLPDKFFSFIDSVLAGIVAFAMVGAITFIFSTRTPEEDAIDERIAYLYSARREESQSAHNFLKEQVILLGAAVSKCVTNYEFLETTPDRSSLRTATTVTMIICNMMKRDRYLQKLPLKIAAEPIDGIQVNGRVKTIRTTPRELNQGWGDSVDQLNGASVALTADKLQFETEVAVEIAPAGELRCEYEYETWGPASEPFTCGANRFVEDYQIRYKNSSASTIQISPTNVDGRPEAKTIPEQITLAPGEERVVLIGPLRPTEDVETTVEIVIG